MSDERFGAVYAILVLNLVPSLELVLREVARVTRKNGVLIFNLPNLSSIFFPAGLYVNIRKKTVTRNRSGFRYSHWYTFNEVKKTLEETGFILERVVGQPLHLNLMKDVDPRDSAQFARAFSKSLYYKARRI